MTFLTRSGPPLYQARASRPRAFAAAVAGLDAEAAAGEPTYEHSDLAEGA
jgi:hypothetical protein